MLRYKPSSHTAQLQDPVDLRAMQAKVDKLIPKNTVPLTGVRGYLNNAKLVAYSKKNKA